MQPKGVAVEDLEEGSQVGRDRKLVVGLLVKWLMTVLCLVALFVGFRSAIAGMLAAIVFDQDAGTAAVRMHMGYTHSIRKWQADRHHTVGSGTKSRRDLHEGGTDTRFALRTVAIPCQS
jgi:hypothetical protein